MSLDDQYRHWRLEVARRWCLLTSEPYSTAALAGLLRTRCGLTLQQAGKLQPAEVLALLDKLLNEAPPDQLVTLRQAATWVQRKKRTLEKAKGRMPPPANKGGGGKAAEWRWSELRPWLENEYGRKLPSVLPTL